MSKNNCLVNKKILNISGININVELLCRINLYIPLKLDIELK